VPSEGFTPPTSSHNVCVQLNALNYLHPFTTYVYIDNVMINVEKTRGIGYYPNKHFRSALILSELTRQVKS